MSTYSISPAPEDKVSFTLPDGHTTIELPYLDCVEPAIIGRIEKKINATGLDHTSPEAARIMVDEFCTTAAQKKAVAKLTLRQITEIQLIWNTETETSLGEFLDSFESSSNDEK